MRKKMTTRKQTGEKSEGQKKKKKGEIDGER